MKVKEAVAQLKTLDQCGEREIVALFGDEMFKRMELRSHGKDASTASMAEGVLKEMEDWIFKVCQGLGWSDTDCIKAQQACTHLARASMRLSITNKK